MLINEEAIELTFKGFKSIVTEAQLAAEVNWPKIAMTVPSGTREETYGWVGNFPQLREWIGPRQVHSLSAQGFTIANRSFESTVSVKREDIADDRLGVYKPAFANMGHLAAHHPEELIFNLLASGFEATCYDGQPFFDTEHPVEIGTEVELFSNMQDGSGPAWFLLDTSKPVRPLIWQEREGYEFVSMTKPTDPNVFMNREYLYGMQARVAAGFGLWQLAFGSKAALDVTSYAEARAAMMRFKSNNGRKIGITPKVMVVPPELEADALAILNATQNAAGASNVWAGTCQLIVTPFLEA